MGDISIVQILGIALCSVFVADFIRLLTIKVVGKRIRVFAVVPDTEQARLTYVSEKLGVPVTKIVVNGNVYYDIDNSEVEYTIQCVPSYQLTIVGEETPIELKEKQELKEQELEEAVSVVENYEKEDSDLEL